MAFKKDYFGTDFQIRFTQREHAILMDMLAQRINAYCGRLDKKLRNSIYDLQAHQILPRFCDHDRAFKELYDLYIAIDGDFNLISYVRKNS